jgi:predicted TIM-barrel fold metal-dependent hydrolase
MSIFPKIKKKRNILYALLAGMMCAIPLTSCFLREISGPFSHEPEDLQRGISAGAQNLIDRAFENIDPDRMRDYHTHIIGTGAGGTGAFVNPNMLTWRHPVKYLLFNIYKNASGIKDIANADAEYMSRLVKLARGKPQHGTYCILAFDRHYQEGGTENLDETEFYVPNDYVFQLAEKYPDLFLPVISVHPYRRDALAELEKWAAQGVRYVKWLPNAMNIDPSSPSIRPFYEKMKQFNMILLSHTGEEKAVESAKYQRLGNPLLLRTPLDMGLKVIMAHCASLGMCADLDSPTPKNLPCFDLFLRMMDEKQYEGLLFADISALPLFNRNPGLLSEILNRQDLHPRLVNGSDYPLPAINILIHTRSLARDGFITSEERGYLNEIYGYNPLLFDFVLKRTLKDPCSGCQFSPGIFTINPELEGESEAHQEPLP